MTVLEPLVYSAFYESAILAYDGRRLNAARPTEDTTRPPADPRLRTGAFRGRGR